MRFNDPLERWLWTHPSGMSKKAKAEILERMRSTFKRLTELIDKTPSTARPKYRNVNIYGLSRMNIVVPPSDLAYAEGLYRQIVLRGGAGSSWVQEGLLELIGGSSNPASVPFWQELLKPSRARDSFSNKRRTYALASFALLAIRASASRAIEALQEAMADAHPETRAMAAQYLSRVYLETGRTANNEVIEALTALAVNDQEFEPRFMARRALASLEQELPTDNSGGAYELKVWHSRDWTVFRIIKIASEQTLDDLHHAIQDAWQWDADHLYSFYMNGKIHDVRYEIAHECTEGAVAYTYEMTLGELGLKPRQKFLYFFDYGDSHEFWVTVKRIHPEAGPDPLPHIVDGKGDPMPQYRDWD
jgi:hypothetical protein